MAEAAMTVAIEATRAEAPVGFLVLGDLTFLSSTVAFFECLAFLSLFVWAGLELLMAELISLSILCSSCLEAEVFAIELGTELGHAFPQR